MQEGPVSLSAGLLDAAVELMGRSGRGATVRVQGSSMLPTLREGQLLAVEFSPDRLHRGDLLLFRQADYLVVHRLLGAARRADGRLYYRTRGDGVPRLDPAVLPERVVGRVLAFRDGERWRSCSSRRTRVYGWCVALHDAVWSALGIPARLGDRVLRKLRLPQPLARALFAVDRTLLQLAHTVLFRAMHPRVPVPEIARELESQTPGVG